MKDKKMKNAPHTLVGFMRIIGKTYKLLWNSSKKIMIASVLITIIGGIMIPLNSIIWGRFIDAVTGVLKGKDKIEAFKWLGLSVCVPLLIQVIGSMKNYLSYMEAGYMNRYITEIIINKIKRVRASAFDDNNFYNYVQKINNESVTRSLGIMRTSLKCIESIVFIISTIAIFVQFDLGIVIFCVLSCIPVLYININIVKKQYNVYNNRFEKLRYILSLKEIFITLTRYSLISLGFIPIFYIFKMIFQINSYTVNFDMILMVLSTIATCGIYYLLTLFIAKDKTLHYALNLVLAKIKRN